MKKPELISIILSVLTLSIGLYCSLTIDQSSFSRSGSLLVVYAVFFMLFGTKTKFNDALSVALLEGISQKTKISKEVRGLGGTLDDEQEVFEMALKNSISHIRDVINREQTKLLRVEASILTIGTIVWSFGDLPFK